jgi:hypothetical protein
MSAEKDLMSVVKFDRKELETAIAECNREVERLEQQKGKLMQLSSTYRMLLSAQDAFLGGNGHRQPQAQEQALPSRQFAGKSIRESAVMVLKTNGAPMHGKTILNALMAGGCRITGKSPQGTLITTMRRAKDQIVKVEGAKNTWTLR